ncbi:MAG: MlrC C-terminal domain-containing protein, partial [Nitriliruptoraceae bacterium]
SIGSHEGFGAVEQGTSALVKIGNVLVAISQHAGWGGVHPSFWNHYGLDATDRDKVKMVVVKTASNFQYFTDVASEIIRVDTPGHTQSRVLEFDWNRLPRPAFPLDDDAGLDFE